MSGVQEEYTVLKEEIKLEPTVIINEDDVPSHKTINNEPVEGIYPCDRCDHVATSLHWLERHQTYGHKHSCDQCYFVATSANQLIEHKAAAHGGRIFSCEQCEYVSTAKRNLDQHRKSKHEGIRYPCDQCDHTATSLGNIKKHKDAVHVGIKYKCDFCDFESSRPGNLKVHKVAKHPELIDLREDVKHHEEDKTDEDTAKGEGLYPCDKCAYVAIDVSWLERHKAFRHKHSCKLCDFDARSPSLLKEHNQAVHEGIRYHCDQCDYLATTERNLMQHKRVKHEGIRFTCDQCEYSATSKGDLNRHRNNIHEDTAPNASASKRKLDQYDSKEVQQGPEFPDPGGGSGESLESSLESSTQHDSLNSERNGVAATDAIKEDPDTDLSFTGIYILSFLTKYFLS